MMDRFIHTAALTVLTAGWVVLLLALVVFSGYHAIGAVQGLWELLT